MEKEEIIGRKFNRLTVIEFVEIRNNHYYYLCKCDCGNYKIIEKGNLKASKIKSCGCLKKENDNLPKKHGKCKTKLYYVYRGILNRCYYKKDISYKNYGGRGITVCKEWQKDFINFYNWAINNGYKDGLTIDRIDINGNYEPSNCKWATRFEQANNKRNNHFVTYNQETHTLSEWSRILNCSLSKIKYFVKKGLDFETITNSF